MSSKRRQQRIADERKSHARWTKRLSAIVLGGTIALLVISVLIPSEAAIADGTYAPLAAGWCVLLVLWATSMWLAPAATVRLGWTEVALAALIGWHSLAAVVALGSVNGRQSVNALWLYIGYGLSVFLLRQMLTLAVQARAMLAAMVWLATLLAALGLYQYGYSMPRLRAQFEADPAQVLLDNQIPVEQDSPQRAQFADRVRSVEPLATFALTNSLAGFLAPWLVAIAGIALAAWFDPTQRRSLLAWGLCAAVIGTCLVLTKSRTAYLAVLVGLVLVAMYGRRGGWKLDLRLPTALAGAALVIGLAAFYFGGLDVQVLSEAPKSVLYRLEYWQGTAALIGDHPLWGCGPGNFQEAYTAYKLPQASESIKDPHNFLLELWATAGTPALVLLLLVMAAFVADLSQRASPTVNVDRAAVQNSDPARETTAIATGAALGLLLAAAVAVLVEYPLQSLGGIPVVWLIGLPLGGALWWLLRSWIAGGEVTLAAVVAALLVVLVNLLAAGALTFPGVMATLLVLMPIGCLLSGRSESSTPAAGKQQSVRAELQRMRPRPGILWLAAAALTATCLLTEYLPVLYGRLAIAQALDALQTGEARLAEERAAAASRADGLWPEPWRLLSDLRLSQWLASGDERDRQAFDHAASEYLRRDPQHHVAFWGRGNWYLTSWRKSGLEADLDEALNAYKQAILRYPNRALYHAQLGWVLHLAGEGSLASEEAERALKLDSLMPHSEQKLSRQRIVDPQLSETGVKLPREETAEQTVQRLRKTAGVSSTAEEMP